MGDQRHYYEGKRNFSSYTYTTLSPRVTIHGVTGKMLEKKDVFKTPHADLPAYNNHSDIYFSPGPENKAAQAKLYNQNHQMIADFDWNHSHKNKDGTFFPQGMVHIQEYRIERIKDPQTKKWKDKFLRSKKAQLMTNEEIGKVPPLCISIGAAPIVKRYFVVEITSC